jgi:hypothetical protein
MNLYIETENGWVKNHPAFEDNLLEAFGVIPEHWEPFVRVPAPELGMYQKLASPGAAYLKINGVWTDVWTIIDMTAEEKAAKQQEAKNNWASLPDRDNFTAWVFDEATCSYKPPIPRPTDRPVFWQGTTHSWVDVPNYPTDGKPYRLDFTSATWVEVSQG